MSARLSRSSLLMLKTYLITVKGKVQGVTYRETTRRKAGSLGLTGTVENVSNGDVKIIVTGSESALAVLTDWCYRGPQMASVSEVVFTEIPIQEFTSFSIKR